MLINSYSSTTPLPAIHLAGRSRSPASIKLKRFQIVIQIKRFAPRVRNGWKPPGSSYLIEYNHVLLPTLELMAQAFVVTLTRFPVSDSFSSTKALSIC
ncbi:hypothetical protein LJR255_004699 [Pararhizobium sp. LjRoot255]|uniref:hypothetical protein n=1 Tax=Pararhizobium sp. LjRoot255 TaxID=3342298 RepID=UPI003ED149F2